MDKYVFPEQEKNILEGLIQPFAVYQYVDKRVVTLILSEGFCKTFGYEDRAKAYYVMDHDMYKYTHPDDMARVADAAVRFANDDAGYDVIYRTMVPNDPEYHIIHAVGKHIVRETGERLAHVWYTDEGRVEDSELNQKLKCELHDELSVRSAYFDSLTGLPNMTYFFELTKIKRDNYRGDESQAIMFIDMSGMKYFNSKYGFDEGNKLLRAFSRLISDTFDNENCCHISGDHFAVNTEAEGIEDKIKKLFAECEKINKGNSLPLRVGIYIYPAQEISTSIACDRAKFACDAIRNTFGSAYNYFDDKLREKEELRRYILTNIDRAVEERWIKVYYQPIVRAVNGRVCDEEALARWIDPVKGFMSPADFIPYLEDAGIIYKLDLCVLEQVLEKIKYQERNGFSVVPHSINISRADFKSCDIVKEVTDRVDAAGVRRSMITIEVTESAVGDNFEFMKEQILKFQQLGFPVWMDDFGSGYSSLDVLSSIKFNLLKFDMSFMRKLQEDGNRKIVLTELMRLAAAIGTDTVCEGVETIEQVHFLQEIGCLKLQGYYYEKPIPLEKILEKYEKGTQIGYENPKESAYYDVVGRANLYDLSLISTGSDNRFNNYFDTLPMGVLEISDNSMHFLRSNSSCRKFLRRFYNTKLSGMELEYNGVDIEAGKSFASFMRKCCNTNSGLIYDEKMQDGSTVHILARKIMQDPVTEKTSVAFAVLSITEAKDGTDYASIARALAADYYNIYYVDSVTEDFIEYSSPVGEEEIAMERHGKNFFAAAKRDTETRIYEEDREPFLKRFTKEKVLSELDKHGLFTASYRLIDTGKPVYVNMKITKMPPEGRYLIIGISIIDSLMKQHEIENMIRMEHTVYSRIMALSGSYLSLFNIDPETGRYNEYSASYEYKTFGFAETGDDFFKAVIENGKKVVYEEDLEQYIKDITKENIMKEIRECGVYQHCHRLVMQGRICPIILKIVSVTENGTERLIAGIRPYKERKR